VKIKAIKDFKWSIGYTAKSFKDGCEYDVSNDVGNTMIDCGYVTDSQSNVHKFPPKKEDLVTENKAIESAPENKKGSSNKKASSKRGRKPKK